MKKANWKEHKGKTAQDCVTGFEGVVVGCCKYLTGCTQYCLQPVLKEKQAHSFPEARWLDINRLSITNDFPVLLPKGAEENGCDITPPEM